MAMLPVQSQKGPPSCCAMDLRFVSNFPAESDLLRAHASDEHCSVLWEEFFGTVPWDDEVHEGQLQLATGSV